MSLDSQELYKGDIIGDHYVPLDAARLRYLGGTSGHWGGWCMPLTELAFQNNPGFEDAHWPIEKKDLDPVLGKALSVLDTRPINSDVVLDGEFGITEFTFQCHKSGSGKVSRTRSRNITCVTMPI
jgi:hypothetical protein